MPTQTTLTAIEEKLNKKFGDKNNNIGKNKNIIETGTEIKDIAAFIQAEINLAVKEKETEYSKRLGTIIDDVVNMTVSQQAKEIVDLIKRIKISKNLSPNASVEDQEKARTIDKYLMPNIKIVLTNHISKYYTRKV